MNTQMIWKAPAKISDYENSLTDFVVSAPKGVDIVYYNGPSGGPVEPRARETYRKLLAVATRVSSRFGLPLVQQPQRKATTQSPRSWFYMMQKAA